MPRPPVARERVLDAFEGILVAEGERAATLDATAAAAGVSKGGLLYHFASRDELITGLIDRLEDTAQEDLDLMTSAPEGPVAYFLRTSIASETALDRAITAVGRVAQSAHGAASEALRRVRQSWAEALRPHVRDETALDLVMLVSDGLYYNNVLDSTEASGLVGPVPRGDELKKLIALVEGVVLIPR